MAKSLHSLKMEATRSAKFRGHTLMGWKQTSHKSAIAECKCGKWVQVNTRPMPNDIEIGGTAVALGCNDR